VNRAIAWMVNNPVAANLLMVVLVVGGLVTLPSIEQEEFPNIETGVIRISVEYLGAAPEEVEEGVCIRIEEQLEGLQDLDRMTSLAVEGVCVVSLELVTGSDANAALDEVESLVNAIDTFPVETEEPVVSKLIVSDPVMQVALAGALDERALKIRGQQMRDDIAALPGVSQVDLDFVRPYEISIEVSEAVLRRHALTFDRVAEAVRGWSLDLPGGSVKASSGEILLRTKGQAYTGREYEEIVVMTRTDGTTLTLGEIADIRDGFEDGELRARLDGDPAVVIDIRRVGGEDILAIAQRVHAYLDEKRAELPSGLRVISFKDESQSLVIRIGTLLKSARSGLVLVLITLGLFLRFRLAMWVAAGVPISFLGAFLFFPALGLTISTLTVMAFILVLGILVDDAIVIGESAYSQERRGVDQQTAAIRGTQAVYVPVVFGVMTTMAAFLPLVLVPGRMGQFFASLGATAILCLVFSLLESQLILPAHLAHRRSESRGNLANPVVAGWQRLQGALGAGLERFGTEHYARALRLALRWRYATLAIAVGVLLVAFALLGSGRLRYQFFPAVEGDVIHAALTMPRGIPVARTEEATRHIEAAAQELIAELDADREGPSIALRRLSSIGELQARHGPPDMSISVGGSHLGEVTLELLPSEERGISSYEVVRRWREKVGSIPDAEELIFLADAFSAGMAIDVELRGADREALGRAAEDLQREFRGYAGVFDVANSFRAGKQEVKLSVRPEARSLGISLGELARQVRQAFYGEEVQRIQRGRDDVRVMLRYPESERGSLSFLEEMRIRAADGTEVPFAAVADAELGRGFATINRTDRMRVVNVTAEVDRAVTTPERVLARVAADMPTILARYPGIEYSLEGEQREQQVAADGLIRGTVLALLIIYALLAVPLGSYLQPLIIMSVIPFGTVGALLGHWIMGWDLVFFSMLGIVALAGVVVNASLVLVHFVNRERDTGAGLVEAVSRAGVARFRPIFLTSTTTFLGLVPLMFDNNIQARTMVPVAISLAYGVLFASVVTLFLVPSLYLTLEDLRAAFTRRDDEVDRERVSESELGIDAPRTTGSDPGFSTQG